MVATALDLVREAASHWLLGEYACVDSVLQGGGTTTVFSDPSLVSYTGDTRYRGYHFFAWNGAAAGDERRIYSTNLVAGELQTMRPLAAAPGTAGYLLTRDFGWSDKSGGTNFLRFLNDTCRSIYIDSEVTLRGQSNLYRMTLPTPISQGNWIQEILVGEYPVQAWSREWPRREAWYRIDKRNVVNDLYLVLETSIDAAYEILFKIRRPLAHQHMSAYSMSRSVLTPFGGTETTDIPRDVLVLGTVWRAMNAKYRTLTGEAREQWRENMRTCAQMYAQAVAPLGPYQTGVQLGYAESW